MKLFLRCLCLICLLVLLQASWVSALTVRLDPTSVNLGAPGATFSVNVVIQDVADLGGFQFSVNYPPTNVTISGSSQVTLGAFLGSTGRTASALAPVIDNTGGKLTFGAFSFGAAPGPTVSGSSLGVLATITFTVQSQAAGLLTLSAIEVTDTAATVLTVNTVGGCSLISVPEAPTGATATAGNAQATVSFLPPASDGGSPITSYTVISTPGAKTVTGASSPLTVTGLTNGTAYTFTVRATNAAGTGPASTPSNSVTPTAPVTVPGAPTGVTATAGNAQATVSFLPPASDGGSPITSYTVISTPGAKTVTGASSPLTVTGLTNGTAYTFTVRATNAAGTGPASTPSNSVTPTAPVTVPGAPTKVTATAGDAQATVSFQPPASDGGSPITGYKMISNPGGKIAKGSSSPITVTGLTNGTTYTFTVRAINAVGAGPPSAPSNKVTPSGDYGWRSETKLPSGADWAGSAAGNGKLYVIGGGPDFNKIRIYNPSTRSWTQRTVSSIGFLLRAAAFSNFLCIFDTSDPGAHGWKYNLKTGNLSPMGGTPPNLEWTSEPAIYNGKVYFFGGRGPKRTTWMFDPSTLKYMKRASMPTAGYGASTAVLNGKIYVIGGNYRYNRIEVYDPSTNSWGLSLAYSSLSLWGWDTAAPLGGKIAIVNAETESTLFFDPATMMLTAQDPMPRVHGDYLTGEALGERLYVAGGETGPKLLDSFGSGSAGASFTTWSPAFEAEDLSISEADCRAVETWHQHRMEMMQQEAAAAP